MVASRRRVLLLAIWIVIIGGAADLAIFHRDAVRDGLAGAMSVSLVVAAAFYLTIGALRGFTLIPATTLIVVAVPFFPPGVLFVLTLAGILMSSASIYLFAEALGLDELIRRRHPAALARATDLLQAHELPIIIAWSFFPLAPTDLICYVCGTLRVNFLKCLLGVGIGEGTICAIYIFLGDQALRWLHLRA